MNQRTQKKDILDFLDNCVVKNPGFFFMDLGHGYFYTANSRLSLYADGGRWALVFEKNGYSNRGRRIELELNYFGNCLSNLDSGGLYYQFNYNSKYVALVDGDALQAIEDEFEEVSPDAKSVLLRDSYVSIPVDSASYRKWVPEMEGRSAPTFVDLARYLAFEHEQICRATDVEQRQCIPSDLPILGTIDEWHHRAYSFFQNASESVVMGDPPSSYETFGLIADALVARDIRKFKPTLSANNHWRNWPDAGSL